MPILRLGSKEANRNLRYSPGHWPGVDRLTPTADVAIEPRFVISPNDRIFTMGSCFAREVEQRLAEMGFDVPMMRVALTDEERKLAGRNSNSILNKYTIHSISNEMIWALSGAGDRCNPEDVAVPLERILLRVTSDVWTDPQLKGGNYSASFDKVSSLRARVEAAARELSSCRIVVITLGLVEAWFDLDTRLYLNGRPPTEVQTREKSRFEFHVLGHDDILEQLERIHQRLKRCGHPDFRILITVSPVPLGATFRREDVLCANTYSKSVQRAAVDAFRMAHDNVDYFPSYEIVTLTDRRRSYQADNIHVRSDMVSEIMERVIRAYAPEVDITPSPRVERLAKQQQGLDYKQHRMLANQAMKSHEFSRAALYYSGLLTLHSDSISVNNAARDRLAYAKCLFSCKDIARGLAQLDLILDRPPSDEELLAQLIRELLKRGRAGNAMDALTRAGVEASTPSLCSAIASVYENLGQRDCAREYFERALAGDPQDDVAADGLRRLSLAKTA